MITRVERQRSSRRALSRPCVSAVRARTARTNPTGAAPSSILGPVHPRRACGVSSSGTPRPRMPKRIWRGEAERSRSRRTRGSPRSCSDFLFFFFCWAVANGLIQIAPRARRQKCGHAVIGDQAARSLHIRHILGIGRRWALVRTSRDARRAPGPNPGAWSMIHLRPRPPAACEVACLGSSRGEGESRSRRGRVDV